MKYAVSNNSLERKLSLPYILVDFFNYAENRSMNAVDDIAVIGSPSLIFVDCFLKYSEDPLLKVCSFNINYGFYQLQSWLVVCSWEMLHYLEYRIVSTLPSRLSNISLTESEFHDFSLNRSMLL